MLRLASKQNEKSVVPNSGRRKVFCTVKLIAVSVIVYNRNAAELSLCVKSQWKSLEGGRVVFVASNEENLDLDKTTRCKISARPLRRVLGVTEGWEQIWGQFKLCILTVVIKRLIFIFKNLLLLLLILMVLIHFLFLAKGSSTTEINLPETSFTPWAPASLSGRQKSD